MLVVIPDTLYGRVGALLSALIVIFCLIGLTMHHDFYKGKPRKDFLCFYTNLSNLTVLVYYSLVSPRLYACASLHSLIPHAEFSLMMCIMLTFSVFHLLLFPAIQSAVFSMDHTPAFYLVCLNNLFVHYFVPWLVFFYWLLCSPGKHTLTTSDALIWTLFPLFYAAYMFYRARSGRIIEETGTPYPYPFMDIQAFGLRRVLLMCVSLYAICICAGLSIVFVLRVLFSALGAGHSLVLI